MYPLMDEGYSPDSMGNVDSSTVQYKQNSRDPTARQGPTTARHHIIGRSYEVGNQRGETSY